MTRRGSRTEGRAIDAGRSAADYLTGTVPTDAPVRKCACGAIYRDYPDSHAAHLTVHGHRPIRKPAPAEAESAPEPTHEDGEAR